MKGIDSNLPDSTIKQAMIRGLPASAGLAPQFIKSFLLEFERKVGMGHSGFIWVALTCRQSSESG